MNKQISLYLIFLLLTATGMVAAATPEVFFSPDKNNEKVVVDFVQGTKKELLIAAYSLTENVIAEAIREEKTSGKDVELVCDKANFKKKNDHCKALGGKADLKSGLMHNKVMIRDRECVLTGSFNFTDNAVRHNRENFLILCDKDTAEIYAAQFKQIQEKNT